MNILLGIEDFTQDIIHEKYSHFDKKKRTGKK
jgi:hypothetical protein